MELTTYMVQIIISLVLFILLCFIAAGLKKFILNHVGSFKLKEFFPQEELLTYTTLLFDSNFNHLLLHHVFLHK